MELSESKEIEVEGVKFRLTMLDAVVGRRLFVRLLKVLGPAARALEEGSSLSMVASLAGGALESLPPELLDELCDLFARQTQLVLDGREPFLDQAKDGPDSFKRFFAGRYMLLLSWVWANLEYNYADFLGEHSRMRVALRARLASLKQARESTSPSTSTGSSTES